MEDWLLILEIWGGKIVLIILFKGYIIEWSLYAMVIIVIQ